MSVVLCYFVALDGRLIKNEDPKADGITVTLEMVLAFATGADHEPPVGFENVPQVQFETRKDRFLPCASTCVPSLILPITLDDPDRFQQKMDYAIIGCHGFGNP